MAQRSPPRQRPAPTLLQRLRAPGSNYGARSGAVVTRMPVLYGPDSSADFNASRLPSPDDYADMRLGYRQELFELNDVLRIAGVQLNTLYFGALLVALSPVLLLFLEGIFGSGIAYTLAALFVGFSAFASAVGQRFPSLFEIVKSAVTALLIVLAIKLVGFLIEYRTLSVSLFSVTAFSLFVAFARRPLEFYRDWLLAAPWLTDEQRTGASSTKRFHPSYALLAVFLLIAGIVPIWSPTIAVFAVLVVAALSVRRGPPLADYYRHAQHLFGQYLTYGTTLSSDAPGIWQPRHSVGERVATLRLVIGVVFLALAVSLSFFGVWDFFNDEFVRLAGDSPGAPEALEKLDDTPHTWILFAIQGTAQSHPLFLPLLIASLVLALVVPAYVFAALFAKPLRELDELREHINQLRAQNDPNDERPEWRWYVDRVRSSPHIAEGPQGEVREAEHLFLGVEPQAQFPILLDERILEEHCYIVGETGSGKTALGILPALLQMLGGHHVSAPTSDNDDEGDTGDVAPDGLSAPPPVLILDLKGDPALFHAVREQVERRRATCGLSDDDDLYAFKFFTPEKDRATDLFNPFASLDSKHRTDIQLAETLLDGLSLNHGEGYGRSYYSRRNRSLLLSAIQNSGGKKPKSLEELELILKGRPLPKAGNYAVGSRTGEKKTLETRDAYELLATIEVLAQYPALATATHAKDASRAIHMPTVLEKRQVVYMWLPSATESVSVREIGKLALYCMLAAAIDRQRSGLPVRQAAIVVDEFQRIAAENFAVILEQARSFGLSAILANQAKASLRTADVDLRPTVQTNTRTKMYFSITDPVEVEAITKTSGQELAFLESQGVSELGSNVTFTQSLKPRFTPNDVAEVSDHPTEFILHVSRGSGYTQFAGMPQRVRTSFPLTQRENTRLKQAPWPERKKHQVVPEKSVAEIEEARTSAAAAQESMERLHEDLTETD